MRKTKIICTIGPSCSDEATLREMALAGMNVARLNFSHGTHEEQQQKVDAVKKVRKELDLPIALLLDTKGPEYRIGLFENDKIYLKEGDPFTFTTENIKGNQEIVSVSYKNLAKEMDVGDTILVNNGLMVFEVIETTKTEIKTICRSHGELSSRKSMSFPNKVLKQIYLSEQDKKDLLFGIKNDMDFVACSFVSCRQDLVDVREFLHANGGDNLSLIAKIENQAGVDNIREICEECDGIMIGRGDMGVEIAFEKLPAIQKHLITECRLLGKRVITATEMLESMIHNVRPTRAEVSDVANAVYDGTSAIMLSGETASGEHPVLAVATMSKIAEATEHNIDYVHLLRTSDFHIKNIIDAISHSTCGIAIDVNAKAIAVCTHSGATARMVSRFRGPVDIVGLTTDEHSYRCLALSWGVQPVLLQEYPSTEVLFYMAKNATAKAMNLQKGDTIIITGGATNGSSGNTNLIKIETID